MTNQLRKKIRRILNKIGIRNKKVFVIGFNKSASTSFDVLFQSMGRPSYHGTKWRAIDNKKLLKKYDCFSDDIPHDLLKLLNLYPNAKYILNVRELESWIYSRLSHIERHIPIQKRTAKWDVTQEAVEYWIKQRNEYHLFVLSHFSVISKELFIVNFIDDESAAANICNFLGYKGKLEKPRKNANPKNRKRPEHHVELLKSCIEKLSIPKSELCFDIYCPSLESEATRNRFHPDTKMF